MMRLWWLPAALVLAGLGLGALAAGRVVSPLAGFIVFTAAAAIGLIFGLGYGGLGLYRLIGGHPDAWPTLTTAAVPLLVGLVVLASFLSTPGARRNDVTTDLADPPIFLAGPAAGRPYPDDFRAWHRETYPDLQPLRLSGPPDAALAKAKALIEARGWSIAAEDRARGLMQAVVRTAVFRFEDDVAIRVRGGSDGTVLDLRSRSRVGRGDRGVNAQRIQAFLEAMKAS
jgi:uncharacterized protein (DUF1499 family)